MCQVYHSNAVTNQHVRAIIQQSDLTNVELADIYNINVQTVSKWRNRDFTKDKSSSPNTIHYALSDLDKELIRVVRTLTWMECKAYVPFYITHILTDNGLEFTDKFARGKNNVSGNHKFDIECSKDNIEHRLTAPVTPKTNGMVERVNGTIKNGTIKAAEYKNIDMPKEDLNKLLIDYNTNRRDGELTKELKVRTPCEAVKSWFDVEPQNFKISPDAFYAIALNGMVQRCET